MSDVKLDVIQQFHSDESCEYPNFDFPGDEIFGVKLDDNDFDVDLNEENLSLRKNSSTLRASPDEPIV